MPIITVLGMKSVYFPSGLNESRIVVKFFLIDTWNRILGLWYSLELQNHGYLWHAMAAITKASFFKLS